jgi:adenine-specific DNA-methyltransferase
VQNLFRIMQEKGKPPVRLLPAIKLARARALRRSQTATEAKLWRLLHNRLLCNAKFRRDHPIGGFFADFCCLKARLIIEVDGGQHANEADADYDCRRTAYLKSRGFKVIRFWNPEIMREPGRAVEQIREALYAEDSEVEPSP